MILRVVVQTGRRERRRDDRREERAVGMGKRRDREDEIGRDVEDERERERVDSEQRVCGRRTRQSAVDAKIDGRDSHGFGMGSLALASKECSFGVYEDQIVT